LTEQLMRAVECAESVGIAAEVEVDARVLHARFCLEQQEFRGASELGHGAEVRVGEL
jgi:hypothetical protein